MVRLLFLLEGANLDIESNVRSKSIYYHLSYLSSFLPVSVKNDSVDWKTLVSYFENPLVFIWYDHHHFNFSTTFLGWKIWLMPRFNDYFILFSQVGMTNGIFLFFVF